MDSADSSRSHRTTHPDGSVTEWVDKDKHMWFGFAQVVGVGLNLDVSHTGRTRKVKINWFKSKVEYEWKYTRAL